MGIYEVPEISNGVFLVGVKDWDRRMFDALIPLPHGTTYNSYLVKGREKTALVDTVNPGFEGELVDRISQVGELEEIDFVIMNHAEPDHAGSIPDLMKLNRDAILICTEKGGDFARKYYGVHELVEAGEDMGTEFGVWGQHAYDINPPLNPDGSYPLLHENGIIGSVLKALVGYDGNPEWLRVLVYVGYWLTVGTYIIINYRKH